MNELTKLIIKLFIDNKKRSDSDRRLRFGIVSGVCGIIANLLIAVFKAAAGLLFSSIALVADAANNLTDAAASVITLFGFKLASKKPDSDHPYGHGRFEYISGLIMAFLILMLGFSLIRSAFERIIAPVTLIFSYVTVAVLILSIAVKLWLMLFYKKIEKITGSKTFGAASVDSRNDVISTSAVLISVLVFKITGINIDGFIGLAVSVFIVISAIGLVRDTLDPLLGQPPEKELVDEIYSRTLKYDGIIGIHDLVVHNYGPGRIFVSFHAEVPAKEDLLKSHDLIDNIEREFARDMGLEVVIHIDPVITDDPMLNALKARIKEILSGIDCDLSMHDFRAVVGPTHTNLIFDIMMPIECEYSEKQLKEMIDVKLEITNPECFTVITFDKKFI